MLSLVQTTKVIAKKEIHELLRTRRLVIIGLLGVVSVLIVAIYHGHVLNSELVEMVNTPEFGIVTGVFGSILAIVLGYDAIAGEKRQKTLMFLLIQPIEKDAIFLGKFVSRVVAIAIVFFSIVSLGMVVQVVLSGNWPALEDVRRVYLHFLATFFGALCWLAFTFLFSSWLRTPVICLIAVILISMVVLPMLASILYWALMAEEIEHMVKTGEPIEYFPWYAKLALVLDPQFGTRSLSAAIFNVPFGAGDPGAIFSVREALAQLITFSLLSFVIGIVLFKRSEPE
jgi:ABC-type transport system involved in multi-copper enzyme maturation permease subunit